MSIALLSAEIFNTPNPGDEAVFINNHMIEAVGSNQEIKQLITAETKVVDLKGKFLMPGMVDAHCHALYFGYYLSMIDLRGLRSLQECQDVISAAVQKAKPGEWIVGRGWNQNLWQSKQEPTRHDLDTLSSDNPIRMVRICGHSEWVNTKCLEVAGITHETADPPGGKIDREPETGHPSGIIREGFDLVEKTLPAPGLKERMAYFLKAQELFLANGITGIHSCESLQEYQAIKAVEDEGKLKLRVYHLLPPEDLETFDRWDQGGRQQSPRLWHGHTKIFADGSLGASTALLHEPYEGTEDNYGIACTSAEEMPAIIEASYRKGRSVAVHAIGDKALTNVLDAIEQARRRVPGDRKDRIEHVQLAKEKDLERMRSMNITACIQPLFLGTDWKVATRLWGEERCKLAYAWNTIGKMGIKRVFSSDAPVEGINPLAGIQTVVTRRDQDNQPEGGWFSEQRLSVEESLSGYFEYAGWLSGNADQLGAVQEGKLADLTVLDRNPLKEPPDEIAKITIAMTLINGELVYQNA